MSAETVETTTTTTVKNLENGTTRFQRIETIRTYWRNMPPNFKLMFFAYGAVTAGCYAVYNYNDGKNALLDYRSRNTDTSATKEWKAIRDGIRSFDNFWDALFFPVTLSSKIMPSVILLMNPPVKKTSTSV